MSYPPNNRPSTHSPGAHRQSRLSLISLRLISSLIIAWSLQRDGPAVLQYTLRVPRLKKEKEETGGGNSSPCPLCTSGLSLFQVIHRPQQRSTLEFFGCGPIIMKGLNVSLCVSGGTNVPNGRHKVHSYAANGHTCT